MELTTFRGKGKVNEIGKVIEFKSGVKYLPIKIEMELSKQVLNFYITETKNTPRNFQIIRRHFTEYDLYHVGDEIQFDFNIIDITKDENLIGYKLKIWTVYNKKIYGLESKD